MKSRQDANPPTRSGRQVAVVPAAKAAWQRYGVALLCVATAVLIRSLLDPVLHEKLPMLTLYGGVAIAVWFGGPRPAAVAAVVGFLVMDYFFVPPRYVFASKEFSFWSSAVAFGFSSSIIIWMGAATQRARERAERSDEKTRMALESIADGLQVLDATGRITYFNPAARQILAQHGLDADSFVGRNFFETFPQTRNEAAGQSLQRCLDEQVVTEAESYYAPWRCWFFVRNYPTADRGVSTFFQDITQRVEAEKVLRARHAQARLLSDISARLVVRGASGQREASEQMTTAVVAEVARHLEAELYLHYFAVEDSPLLRLASWSGLGEKEQPGWSLVPFGENLPGLVAQRRQPVILEDLQNGDEERAAALRTLGVAAFAGYPMLANGRLIGTISFGTGQRPRFTAAELELIQTVADLLAAAVERDQLEESVRASEERLATVLEQLPVGVSMVDCDGKIRLRNSVMRKFVPATIPALDPDRIQRWRAKGADGHWLQPKDWPAMRALRGERVVPGVEFIFTEDDGRDLWVSILSTPLRDGAGTVVGAILVIQDIDEQKRAEEAVRASREQLHLLIENAAAFVVSFDPEERFVFANRRYAARFGVAPEAVVGKRIPEVIGQPAYEAIRTEVRAALQGETVEFEREVPYRLIGPRWVRAAFVPNRDDQGVVRGFVALITDIHERKLAEEELRATLALLEAVNSATPDLIFAKDREGRITYLNEATRKRIGLPREQIRGRTEVEYVGDNAFSRGVMETDRRVMESGKTETVEETEPHGKRTFLVTKAPQIDTQGHVIGLVGVGVDMTERKRFEEALRREREQLALALRVAHMGVYEWNQAAGSLFWSSEIYRVFGVDPQTFVPTLESFNALVHPEDRAAFWRQTEWSPAAEHEVVDQEFRIFRPDGSVRWIANRSRTEFTAEGSPLRTIGIALDITERRLAEENLRAAKEQLETASRAKDHFLAALSHELRTPLTPVLMTASALREDENLPEEVREQLGMIQRNVALEARLIDDLLDLTRITRGKLALRSESCNAHALIDLVVEIVREEAREKQIEISTNLTAQHSQLTGDSARLQQVFWNILRNAVKFTPAGGTISIGTFDLPAGPEDLHPDWIRIVVQDSGIGLAAETVERIFEPFEQGTPEHEMRFGGLGLGLAIARTIVDLHHGRIRAESAGAGLGSSFTVELPMSQVSASAAAPAVPEDRADSTETPKNGRSVRLLVVEDHPPTLQVLTRLLVRTGYHVVSASTVRAARAAAASQTFDAVVSDLGLPDGTGIELMSELRAEYRLRGIALSGYGMEEDLQRSREAGFVAHLVKPVDVIQLRHQLRLLLR